MIEIWPDGLGRMLVLDGPHGGVTIPIPRLRMHFCLRFSEKERVDHKGFLRSRECCPALGALEHRHIFCMHTSGLAQQTLAFVGLSCRRGFWHR
jgi:hypothetical protein